MITVLYCCQLLLLCSCEIKFTHCHPIKNSFAFSRKTDICQQPPPRSEGVCTIEIEGFYFDPRTNDCEMYVLGGCHTVPGQSFGSRQDCLDTCVHLTRRLQDLRYNEWAKRRMRREMSQSKANNNALWVYYIRYTILCNKYVCLLCEKLLKKFINIEKKKRVGSFDGLDNRINNRMQCSRNVYKNACPII